MSDDAAHDDAKPFSPPPILEHPLVCADEPTLVSSASELAEAVEYLRQAGTFGYDTEFIGENSYYPHLCLIQAATPSRVMLIDPLAIEDLSPWWALLADASLTKIVHAGAQDIEPVMRLFGQPARGMFDTQVAAGLAGLDYPLSLGNTVQAILEVEHDAGAKFSRWDRRPLSPQQIHYAAGDVRYLCAIHAWLSQKLESLNNAEFARQAFEEICDPARYANDPLSRKIKAKGLNKLSRKKRAVFNAILIWREGLAREQDITPRGLLSDEAAYEIADQLPENTKQLTAVRFVPRPVCNRHGDAMIGLIQEAIDGPYPKKNKPPTYDRDEHRALVNLLMQRIAKQCESRHIIPAAITSKRELGPLVGAAMDGRPIPQLSVNTGWRKSLLGHLIDDDALILADE